MRDPAYRRRLGRRQSRNPSGSESARSRRASSMLRPVTTSTTGPDEIVELAERGQRCGRGALDAETDLPERGDGSGDLPLRDEQHAVGGRLERGNRERDSHAHRQAVGERRGAVTRNRALGAPALDHDRRLARRDTDAQSRGCTLTERSADPGEQRAVPDGNDDGSRRFGKLLEHLGGDRRIPVELRGLGTVLEEGHVDARPPTREPRSFESSTSAAREPDLGSELTHQIELRAADVLRRVDDSASDRAVAPPTPSRTRDCRWRP